MPGLDQYAGFLLSAFGVSVVVLGGYALYLRSRLNGLRRPQSARNVSAAPPMPTTAHAASSAKGPSTP